MKSNSDNPFLFLLDPKRHAALEYDRERKKTLRWLKVSPRKFESLLYFYETDPDLREKLRRPTLQDVRALKRRNCVVKSGKGEFSATISDFGRQIVSELFLEEADVTEVYFRRQASKE